MSQFNDTHNETVRRFALNLWSIIWSRLWILIILMLISSCIAISIIMMSDKSFRSSATIKLDIMKLASFSDQVIPTSFLADDLIVDTEIQIMSSRGVAERVIQLGDAFNILGGTDFSQEQIRQNALQKLARGLQIQREGSTSLVTVYFTHTDPKFAAFIADGLVDVYIDFKLDLQSQRIEHKREYLELEIQSTLKRLQEAENNTLHFARDSGLPHHSEKTLDQLEEEILKRDQIEQSVKLLVKEQNYRSLKALNANTQDPLSLKGSILVQQINPQISFVQNKYTQASLEIAILRAAGNAPPENSETMRNLEALGNSLIELVIAARDQSKVDFDLSKKRLDETVMRYDDVRQKTELSISDQNALQKLKDEEEAIRTEFENLNAQLQNIWGQNNFLEAPAERISNAIPSLSAHSPNPSRILISSWAISIMLFGLFVLISRQIFARVELVDDIPVIQNVNIIELFQPSKFKQILHRKAHKISRLDTIIKSIVTRKNRTIGFVPINEFCKTSHAIQSFLQSANRLGFTVSVLNMSDTAELQIPKENIEKYLGKELEQQIKKMRTKADIVLVVCESSDRFIELPNSLSYCDEACILIDKKCAEIDHVREMLKSITKVFHKNTQIIFQH